MLPSYITDSLLLVSLVVGRIHSRTTRLQGGNTLVVVSCSYHFQKGLLSVPSKRVWSCFVGIKFVVKHRTLVILEAGFNNVWITVLGFLLHCPVLQRIGSDMGVIRWLLHKGRNTYNYLLGWELSSFVFFFFFPKHNGLEYCFIQLFFLTRFEYFSTFFPPRLPSVASRVVGMCGMHHQR